jgi:hypothetical protein
VVVVAVVYSCFISLGALTHNVALI